MKYWQKHMLQLAAISAKWRKNYFHWSEKQFSTSKNKLFLSKLFSSNPIMVSTSSKIALTKKILFPLGAKSVSTSWMKDIEKYVTTIRKSCIYFKKFLKKMVFNGASLKTDFYLVSIIVSTSKQNLRNKK